MNMKNLICIGVLVATAASVNAATAYRFADGKLYVNTVNGPELLRIVELPETPVDPDKPNPFEDITKVSREAAAKVSNYAGKDRDQLKLAAYYTALARSVDAGSIPRDKLPVAVNETFRLAVGTKSGDWAAWKNATTQAFADAPIETQEQAALGLVAISDGLVDESANAIDWERLIEFFIEVILPLIIKLIESA